VRRAAIGSFGAVHVYELSGSGPTSRHILVRMQCLRNKNSHCYVAKVESSSNVGVNYPLITAEEREMECKMECK